eukprot:702878-Prorocentrum_minimum.AAC.1
MITELRAFLLSLDGRAPTARIVDYFQIASLRFAGCSCADGDARRAHTSPPLRPTALCQLVSDSSHLGSPIVVCTSMLITLYELLDINV